MNKKTNIQKNAGFTHQNFSKKVSGGFTIIETLISITLFSIAVTGVITVAAKGGVNSIALKNRVTATYLADEGIELMRGMRDTEVLRNTLPSDGWFRFVTDAVSKCSTNPCDIDGANSAHPTSPIYPQFDNFVTSGAVTLTVGGVAGLYYPLYYDSMTGFYGDSFIPNGATPYYRALKVVSTPPNEMQVTSTVVWKEGATLQSMSQTESIFNWYNE